MAIDVVTYNGFSFDYVNVKYSGQSLWDDTDRTLQGYLMTFRVNAIVTAASPSEFVNKIDSMHTALSQSRKRFTWSVNGTTVYDIVGEGGVGSIEDRRFGPKPRNVEVEQITGGVSSRVSFEIQTTISFCSSSSDIEEFWWSFSYSHDRNFTTTRTVTGKFRVKNGIDPALTIVNNPEFWPPLPFNFQRESSNYQTDPTGTIITFTVVDRGVWRTIPKPLTNGQATFNIQQQGALLFKTLQCSFEAPHDVNKQVILQFIIALMRERFPNAVNVSGTNPERSEWIVSFELTNHEFENRIDASITTKTSAETLRNPVGSSLTLPDGLFGDVADVSPSGGDDWDRSDGEGTLRGMTGTSNLVPVANDPFDVCISSVPLPTDNTRSSGADRTGEGNDVSDGFPTVQGDSILSDAHHAAPYISYVETYQYMVCYNLRLVQVQSNEYSPEAPKDIVQQKARPVVKIIQVGMARRINQQPIVPAPAYYGAASEQAYVLEQHVKPHAPRVTGDGRTIEFGVGWTYVLLLPNRWGMAGAGFPDGLNANNTAAAYIPINRQISQQYVTTLHLNDSVEFAAEPEVLIEPDGKIDVQDLPGGA